MQQEKAKTTSGTSPKLEYAWWLKKQGYKDETIRCDTNALRILEQRGATLLDAETVKDTISKQKWSGNRKRNVINAYALYLKMHGLEWEKPRFQITQKMPFIPTESELDALIAGCGRKTSTFLQLLKETAIRSGEAKRLQWINLDIERRIVTLNDPEKNSNARMWKVSQKLVGMLEALPHNSQRIFGDGPINGLKSTFTRTRRRIADKLQNPRIASISLHTFRHWKATMLYHQTRDPYYVKSFLGHKSLRSTEIYINIEKTLFEPGSDEFTVKATDKPEEIKMLLETGFEYVCQKDDLAFLRKRK